MSRFRATGPEARVAVIAAAHVPGFAAWFLPTGNLWFIVHAATMLALALDRVFGRSG